MAASLALPSNLLERLNDLADVSSAAPAYAHPKLALLPAQTPQSRADFARQLELSGVFRGRELTRKDRRLPSGIARLDTILHGGIPRGRVSEITGSARLGKTSLAAAFAAAATRGGEAAAWLDAAGTFDPLSAAAAGIDLTRILWASFKNIPDARNFDPPLYDRAPLRRRQKSRAAAIVKAAELILEAGGFAIVVIDFGDRAWPLTQASALRLARASERSGAAMLALASRATCGTFSALSLALSRTHPRFSQSTPHSPAMFDGLVAEVTIARNKLGASGASAPIEIVVDPYSQPTLETPRARAHA